MLAADTRGVMIPYVAVLMTVIVAVAALALDGARYESLNTQLQNGADALALAGAAELDRLPDSITRATAAICGQSSVASCTGVSGATNMVSNSSLFGTGGSANVTVSSLCFLSSVNGGANSSVGACLCASATSLSNCASSDQVRARFVQVIVSPVSIPTILPTALLQMPTTLTTEARAVAGNDTTVCRATPIFTCNPWEQTGDSYADATGRIIAATGSSTQRLMELISTQNNPGTYTPGNFGYLQPESGSYPTGDKCGPGGVSSVVQAVAQVNSGVCTQQNGVNFQTGNDQNVYDAWDARFDDWSVTPTGSFNYKSCQNNSSYAPDVNVRKGFLPGSGSSPACTSTTAGNWPPGVSGSATSGAAAAAMGFPLDNAMLFNAAGSYTGTPNQAITLGDGAWTCGDITNLTSVGAPVVNGKTSTTITLSGSTTGLFVGMGVTSPTVLAGAVVSAVSNSSVTLTGTYGTLASGSAITFAGYWSTAHKSSGAAAPTGCGANGPATISRYAVYAYEIAQGLTGDASAGGEVGSGSGAAMCSQVAPVAGRRVLHVAFVNCLALQNSGIKLNGSANDVPVAAYGKMFMTLPIPTKYDVPYVEFSGLDKPGDGYLYDAVQLYR